MAKKSRYQMINRGRKGKPCWYVEDFHGLPEGQVVGKCLFTDRIKYRAEGFLKTLREQEQK